jgi:acetoin utilization deacetylase AcuC-like enzyme
VPLKDGIQDDPFLDLFTSIVDVAVKRFSPDAVVMQCGAGSLAGDRAGSFNLTHIGHCAWPSLGFALLVHTLEMAATALPS